MITRYHILKSFKELRKLVIACKTTGYASVDFETNAKPLYNNDFKPTILSVTFQPGSGISIPLQHFDPSVEYLQKNNKWLRWLRYFGKEVIEKFQEALSEFGTAEKKPILEGRYMSIILSPVKQDKK